MGSKTKNRGFNAPFTALKSKQPPKFSTPYTAQKAAVAPTASVSALDDTTLFLREMADCAPIAPKVERELAPVPPSPVYAGPTEDELAMAELHALVRGEGAFRVHESEEVHFGLAPGVSNTLLDGLRRGQYAYHHCLDLHGMVRDEAHAQVSAFVARSRCRLGASCVLIVTGRGKGSPTGTSVLREALPRWLTRSPVRPHVLAFCTARAVDGGPGAFYVLLRRQGVAPFGNMP